MSILTNKFDTQNSRINSARFEHMALLDTGCRDTCKKSKLSQNLVPGTDLGKQVLVSRKLVHKKLKPTLESSLKVS